MEEKEIWKDIAGFEGMYQISNMGRVKSLERITPANRRIKERIMKPYKSKYGYPMIDLCKDSIYYKYLIHRLVAQAFIPNPTNLPVVNHKDENPKNNNVNNLEWCTQKYNSNYGTRNQRLAEKKSKPVIGINKITGLILEFDSAREAERKLGIRHVSECCNGKYKSAGNFYWYYSNADIEQ